MLTWCDAIYHVFKSNYDKLTINIAALTEKLGVQS